MEEFNNNFNQEENFVSEEETSQTEDFFDSINDDSKIEESFANPINYSAVKPIDDYKPMSKGLKIFAIIMAAMIVLSASCVTGYFFGKNSNNISNSKDIEMSLAAKPKETDELTPAQIYNTAASFISTIKVDSPNEMLSLAPTRVKILSTKPIRALSAGTKQPI